MKWTNLALMAAIATFLVVERVDADTFSIAISPPASAALNLGSEIYPGDHALGLSAANESSQPSSAASGGVLGSMLYDDVSNMLSLDFGYGSAFGFNDLESDWNGGIHIHGDGTTTAQFPDPNTNAGVTVNLGPLHTSSGLRSGRVVGNVTLSDTQETWLLDNQLYLNIHTNDHPPGEIRGQLVAVPEPTTLGLISMLGLSLCALRRRLI